MKLQALVTGMKTPADGAEKYVGRRTRQQEAGPDSEVELGLKIRWRRPTAVLERLQARKRRRRPEQAEEALERERVAAVGGSR
jgi:hypothetical protein